MADKEIDLRYAIEEAFSGDFTALKERCGIFDTDIIELKKLRGAYFLQFEATVKAHVAMKAIKDKE